MVGGVASSTVIVWTQELELPQSSVARQVLAITLSAEQTPGVTTSVNVIVAEASQLSVAVAVPVAGGKVLAPHCSVTFCGQLIIGGVLSSTKMV